jgi:HAD superfamily hydrolase (TIGR01509 family)
MQGLKQKRIILWDHDGVLVDTEKWYYEATRKALAELEVFFNMDLYLDYMQEGKSLWLLASGQGVPDEIIREHKECRNAYYQEYLQREDISIPGVEETLELLGRNYSMAIVTTSKRRDFDLIHRERRICSFMDFILTIEDYERAKPDPDPFLKALEIFSADPREVVVIEDSGRGLCSAVAAGIDCIIVKNEFTQKHDFSKALAIVDKIGDLTRMLL